VAIKINYLDGGKGIEIIASGVVNGEEIISAHDEIYSEENLKKQKYQIIDRTHCAEYNVSAKKVKRIAELDKAAARSNQDIIIAMIASSQLQFGISRMWEIHAEESQFVTKVFRDRKSADEWIKERLGTK
jgi:hypothetical protein